VITAVDTKGTPQRILGKNELTFLPSFPAGPFKAGEVEIPTFRSHLDVQAAWKRLKRRADGTPIVEVRRANLKIAQQQTKVAA
jgi:hypothetical protein